LADAVGLVQEVARRTAQFAHEAYCRRPDDPGPLAVLDGDQAGLLERHQCLAHGRTSDAMSLHQLALRRQDVARMQMPVKDLILQASRDLLIDFLSADRVDGCQMTGSLSEAAEKLHRHLTVSMRPSYSVPGIIGIPPLT